MHCLHREVRKQLLDITLKGTAWCISGQWEICAVHAQIQILFDFTSVADHLNYKPLSLTIIVVELCFVSFFI